MRTLAALPFYSTAIGCFLAFLVLAWAMADRILMLIRGELGMTRQVWTSGLAFTLGSLLAGLACWWLARKIQGQSITHVDMKKVNLSDPKPLI